MDVAVAAEIVVGEGAAGVSVTSTSTRGMLVSRGTTKTHGTVRMVEAEITGEGVITNIRTTLTLPQLKLRTILTGGTHHKTIIRTTNRVGTEDHLSHRMTHGLRINNPPMEVAEEGTIQCMMVRTAPGRMGTVEEVEALLLIGEGVSHTAAVGMVIKEAREGGMGMVATVVDIINPHITAVTAEAVTTEAAVITLVEAISLVEVISPVEATSPVDHTVLVSSLMGTEEDTTKEAEVVEEGTDHRHLDRLARESVAQAFSTSVSLLLPADPGDPLPCL